MSNEIFVCYRRSDAASAQLIVDRLRGVFGDDAVFMDITRIDPGASFETVLLDTIAACEVFIPVIGDGFIEELGRLADDDDFVGKELAAALEAKTDIVVIPVCMEGEQMPRADQLPDRYAALAGCQAVDAPHGHFDAAMDRVLLPRLRKIPGMPAPDARRRRMRLVGAAVSALLAVPLGYHLLSGTPPSPAALVTLAKEATRADIAVGYALEAWDRRGENPVPHGAEAFKILTKLRPGDFEDRIFSMTGETPWTRLKYLPRSDAFLVINNEGLSIKTWQVGDRGMTERPAPSEWVHDAWVLGEKPLTLALFYRSGRLAFWSEEEGEKAPDYGMMDGVVTHVSRIGDTLYVAGDKGLRTFASRNPVTWLTRDPVRRSVAVTREAVVFSTDTQVFVVPWQGGIVEPLDADRTAYATFFQGAVMLHGRDEAIMARMPVEKTRYTLQDGPFDGMLAGSEDDFLYAWRDDTLFVFSDVIARPRSIAFEAAILDVSLSAQNHAVVELADRYLTILDPVPVTLIDTGMRWPVPERADYYIGPGNEGYIIPTDSFDTWPWQYSFTDEPLSSLRRDP